MKILVVLAHPNPHSFNHAIAVEAVATLRSIGHTVIFRDLYREGFDPVLPVDEIGRDASLDPIVQEHCEQISSAEGIVIVHPNWWGQPPAILTGWIDRVFRPGVAYRFIEGDDGEGVPLGLLAARTFIVFNTANTPESRERAVFGDPLELIWRNCICGLCSTAVFYRRIYRVVCTSTPDQRSAWLADVRALLEQSMPVC